MIATAGEVRAADGPVPPIGRPVDGVRVYLLDGGGRRVPAGAEGEICIGGEGVARGYLNDRELTEERFVPDPFAPVAGGRMYRSGDLAVELPDGRLVFRGRADRQLKVRGFRVEPAEVEAAMCEVDGVRQAAVVPQYAGDGSLERVIGFVVCTRPDGSQDVRTALARKLPRYMVPDIIEPVALIPVTPSGKRDDAALLTAFRARAERGEEGHSGADIEQVIRDIWCDVLAVRDVDPDDNFFALGGDSVQALSFISQLKIHGMESTLAQVIRMSLRELADALAARATSDLASRDEKPHLAAVEVAEHRVIDLTPQQEAIWVEEQLGAGSSYLAQSVYEFDTSVSEHALGEALYHVLTRHQILRASFHMSPAACSGDQRSSARDR